MAQPCLSEQLLFVYFYTESSYIANKKSTKIAESAAMLTSFLHREMGFSKVFQTNFSYTKSMHSWSSAVD